ncbi:UDP-N-acetylmuramoyl-tripeptide--D-alanyl-D-alanine ligase [Cohnella rhizosphaerae]|uniref:UDP-N-acetylmuramoyl-tripeptide--D-alanyl-D-alanine ligase n=1 Tax=Cohnella rhizosphaerae TaxID=1457232 RepID=A0A9X4KX75_9BACL|nr:UDP-N-acetylmuramoyl-tripeptide--D-alanyl-D-alanine ligase [Cohnella rhizosphaerae]MDG0812198.1 UDP-N-acetylmuramoyl-tripeptide--D-alanyl-D-alanine ligase [Cohnella rhizosphaerae]
MIRATLSEVAAWCGAELQGTPAGAEPDIAGVSIDSRSIGAGQLFVPIAGERFDGHDYIETAASAGAAAALWQRGRALPSETGLPLLLVDDTLAALQRLAASYLASWKPKVVGVTGSNGKTTTKDLIFSALATVYRTAKTEGNFNNHIGLPLTILRADRDTEVLVLEMGMSAFGEISLLSRIARPDIAVITNIGESHLEHLGSRRGIAQAKLEIAEGLKDGGTLIYNGDEPLLREELAALALPPGALGTITFGESEACDLRALDIATDAECATFIASRGVDADAPDGDAGAPGSTDREGEALAARFAVPIPGRHNAVNALAAIAVARRLGVADADIARGLAEAKLTGMRIERVQAKNGALVLNDAYNASPASVRAAIALVAQLRGYRRKWLVLGDMLELGPDEAAYHAAIGRELSRGQADGLLAYGPRSAHTAEAASQAMPSGTVRHFTDKNELADALLTLVEPDDLVLVKASRGMRLEEIVRRLAAGKEEGR